MKIVNVGDILISPEAMARATANFERYDEVKNFYFGPRDKDEFRMYARNMEARGSLCAQVPDEIMGEIADADVLQVHMMVVPEKVFEIGKKLKVIASNRGGTENIDLKAAEKFGVPVITNPAHNANAVADYTVAMMLAETRNISRCHAAFEKSRTWLEVFPNSGKIYEMKSKVIGLVGFGSIAHLVAYKLIHGFGCRVVTGRLSQQTFGRKVQLCSCLSTTLALHLLPLFLAVVVLLGTWCRLLPLMILLCCGLIVQMAILQRFGTVLNGLA